MNQEILKETVQKLLTKGKGILAADESNGTCTKRLEEVGIKDVVEETRREYREMLLEAPDFEKYVSGVILYDETFWQKNSDGVSFVESLEKRDILPGIKIDTGVKDLPGYPGETITSGLDDLDERAEKYAKNGAKFTKWRAVIKIDQDSGLPTDTAILENADILGNYASIVQKYNLVPIVEPEVLITGDHNLQTSYEVTKKTVEAVMSALKKFNVYLPGVILKTSMVINGNQNVDEASPEEVANATIKMLEVCVPSELGGVVFLSGGQTPVEASAHLDAMAEKEPLPWEIAFSYARALQEPALNIWLGKPENIEKAQEEFIKRLKLNQLADLGKYDIDLEYLD